MDWIMQKLDLKVKSPFMAAKLFKEDYQHSKIGFFLNYTFSNSVT